MSVLWWMWANQQALWLGYGVLLFEPCSRSWRYMGAFAACAERRWLAELAGCCICNQLHHVGFVESPQSCRVTFVPFVFLCVRES